jgi:hypothetical protein
VLFSSDALANSRHLGNRIAAQLGNSFIYIVSGMSDMIDVKLNDRLAKI